MVYQVKIFLMGYLLDDTLDSKRLINGLPNKNVPAANCHVVETPNENFAKVM